MAVETVSRAGWVLTVRPSSSSGPSQQSVDRGKPSASSASSNVRRAAGEISAQALPMPGFWDPWPGKTNPIFLPVSALIFFPATLPAHHVGAPGEAGAEGGKEEDIAGVNAAAAVELV